MSHSLIEIPMNSVICRFVSKLSTVKFNNNQQTSNGKQSTMETVERETLENESNEETPEEDICRIQSMERKEYLEKLKTWLYQASLWHYSVNAGLPFNFAENDTRENSDQEMNNILVNLPQINLLNVNGENVLLQRFVNNLNNRNLANVISPTTQATRTPGTYAFVMPPLWKRRLAKLMDFLILFSFKMALTIILMESFETIDMEMYGFDSLQNTLENSEG